MGCIIYNMEKTKPENSGRNEDGTFAKGFSGNPAGKPKGTRHLSTLLWEALQKKAKKDNGEELEETYADLIIKRLLSDNIKYGKRTELIFDRIDGAAKQEVDITTDGEKINSTSDIDIMEIAGRVSQELKKKKTQ